MITTGAIRRIDDLGRIVIPKDIRRRIQAEEGTPMEFFIDGTNIVLKRYRSEQEKKEIVKCGEWENDSGYDDWHCSECGFEINYDGEYPAEYDNFKYCGCCGAKMQLE